MTTTPVDTHTDLTPAEIVERLNADVVGQDEAKRLIAIALRNRTRRLRLPDELRDQMISPNVLLTGPIGVGKTALMSAIGRLPGVPMLSVSATAISPPGRNGQGPAALIASAIDQWAAAIPDNGDHRETIERQGVVFIDDIDRLIAPPGTEDLSASESLQRSLMPVLQGTTIETSIGAIHTAHMLFVAAGTFGRSRPNDLVPDLLARFPVRIDFHPLDDRDLYRVLCEARPSLPDHYTALLQADSVSLTWAESGLREIALYAWDANQRGHDTGARRLVSIVERVLEEVSFTAPSDAVTHVVIDEAYVRERMADAVDDDDLSTYIL